MARGSAPGERRGGREVGIPNKRTLVLQELLQNLKLNPAEKIAELLPQLEPRDQCAVLLKLMEFLYPKRKALEVSGPNGDVLLQQNQLTHALNEETTDGI